MNTMLSDVYQISVYWRAVLIREEFRPFVHHTLELYQNSCCKYPLLISHLLGLHNTFRFLWVKSSLHKSNGTPSMGALIMYGKNLHILTNIAIKVLCTRLHHVPSDDPEWPLKGPNFWRDPIIWPTVIKFFKLTKIVLGKIFVGLKKTNFGM